MDNNIETKLLKINTRIDTLALDIAIIKDNHLQHIETDINSLNFKTDRIEDKVDKTYWILLTAAGAFIGILLVNLFKLID
jgi:hypothetical protein